jgi:hypothetical protein
MMFKRLLFLCAILALGALSSFADVAFTVPAGGPANLDHGVDDPVNLGMIFTPLTNITVFGLGAYYQGSADYNPLAPATEVVALFQNTGATLLAQTPIIFTPGPAAGYQFAPVTQVTLLAGQEYTVDVNVGPNSWAYDPSSPITDPNLTLPSDIFLRTRYAYTSALEFPTAIAGITAYYGPNLEFRTATTPEPGLYGVLALGFAGLIAAVRRRTTA